MIIINYNNFGFKEYIYAYYYSVVTMVSVGYGDISPVNQNEVIMSILFMLITCGMFAFIINKIGQIIDGLNKNSYERDSFMIDVNSYSFLKLF